MTTLTRYTLFIFAALLPSFLSASSGEQEQDEKAIIERILNRAVEAAGGAEVLESIEKLKIESELWVSALNLTGTITVIQEGKDSLYVRQFLPVEGFPNGGIEEVYSIQGDQGTLKSDLRGNRELSREEIRSARLSNDTTLMLRFDSIFENPRYLGKFRKNEIDVEGIEVKDPITGEPMHFYFSRESGHLTTLEMTIVSEEMQVRTTVHFGDFREVKEAVFPFHMWVDMGLGVTEIKTKSISVSRSKKKGV